MNKATIVEDAITYIETQQNIVQSLSYELHEMEATSKEIKPKKEEINLLEMEATPYCFLMILYSLLILGFLAHALFMILSLVFINCLFMLLNVFFLGYSSVQNRFPTQNLWQFCVSAQIYDR